MAMNKLNEALLLLLLTLIYFKLCLCNGGSVFGCKEGEMKALLDFKDGIIDPGERLSSWIGQDCCIWQGVQCDNQTRHVVRLDLRNIVPDKLLDEQSLGGDISSSLLGLKHLRYLDLSMNNFGGISIPTFFGSFESLRYLNISTAGFNGAVPHQLGDLFHLNFLDLSDTLEGSSNTIYLVGSHWLANLSSLKYLNLNNLNLSRAPNLLKVLNTLPLLSDMHLSGCDLHIPLSLRYVNFANLRVIDLSYNNVSSIVPLWLFKLASLEYLDLSYNAFQGLVPSDVGNLTSLKVLNLANNGVLEGVPATLGNLCMLEKLDLSWNNFSGELIELEEAFSGCVKNTLQTLQWTNSELTGHLPLWVGNLKSLQRLDLSSNSFYGSLPQLQLPSLQELNISENKLNGTIPEHLGDLFPELLVLDLSSNNPVGLLTEEHFTNLTKLEFLYMSSNALKLVVNSNWIPPLGLKIVYLSDCELGPGFPTWIQKLENITSISMSHARIADNLPNWFWNFSLNMQRIDLSHNNIKGQIPGPFKLLELNYLDLSYNHLDGPLPEIVNNSFSSATVPKLFELFLSSNNFTGSIPNSVCKMMHLRVLDLSENKLTGVIPDCWNHSHANLQVMDLSYNNLHGGIPRSVCSIPLTLLHLSNNIISGELPASLKNCTWLSTFDLGHNKINGSIPTWFGENLSFLQILRLSSNMITGSIPQELGSLSSLQIINLASNHLSGVIPHSFGNFSAMKDGSYISTGTVESYTDSIEVTIKGRDDIYNKILLLLCDIDLSDNELSGEIPEELTTLSYLLGLNLSRNHLSGKLPEKIGEMKGLESLDLSMNNLSGVIPPTLAELSSLGVLNLSYNNFYGKIPSGGQLDALPFPSNYFGNDALCGSPLEVKCPIYESSQPPMSKDDERFEDETIWFYWGIPCGFILGICAVCSIMLLNRKWRFIWFRYVDIICDKLYVIVAVNLAKIGREPLV